MVVPIPGVHRDTSASGLDQPARQQGSLAIRVPAVAVAKLGVFALDGEGRADVVAGDHLHRLRLERVEARHDPAGVDLAAERVKLFQNIPAGSQGVEREPARKAKIRDPKIGGVGVGPDLEGLIRRAEIDRALIAERFRLGHGHISGHVARPRPFRPRDHRAERRLLRSVARQSRAEIAGLHPVRRWGVDRVAMMHRANDRELVHHLRLPRETLGDHHARGGGRDRPVRASEWRGGVGLEVIRVLLAHAAVRPEDDQRAPSRRRIGQRRGQRPPSQHVGKPEPQHRNPKAQQSAAGERGNEWSRPIIAVRHRLASDQWLNINSAVASSDQRSD